MSSDRINFQVAQQTRLRSVLGCLRQPVRGPEGHLTKTLGNLWARTLFFLLIRSSKRHLISYLSNFGAFPTTRLPGQNQQGCRPTLWCLVFCSPSRLFHHDPKFTILTRTRYLLGMTKQSLLSLNGPPTSTSTDGNGGEILVYEELKRGYTESTGYITVVHKTMFYVNSSGIIYDWLYKKESRLGQ